MLKTSLKALAAVAALAAVSPASAAIYTYNLSTGSGTDVLRIDTVAQAATYTGAVVNATMTSADFAAFTGGAAPTFVANLATLTGTRIINGVSYAPNAGHQQQLKFMGTSVKLWSWWGPNNQGGDYVTTITSYGTVPEPGMLGLMGATLAGVALTRRRRKALAA